MIFSLILPFFFLVGLNFFTISLTKKKFGHCLPVTMIGVVLVVYFSQMLFHSFRYGMIVVMIAAAVGCILFFVYLGRKKTDEIKELFFSNGFWVFIVIYAFYVVVDYNRSFLLFDEFYHWGTMVKESIRLDSFYSVPDSNLWIHKDYPPFMTIFEYIWCKIGGGYSESVVSCAMHVFLMGMLLPAPLERLTEKKKRNPLWVILHGFIFMIIFLMLIMFLDPWPERVITSVLVDILLPVVFVYAMYLVYSKDAFRSRFGLLSMILTCTSMLLIKQSGMFFLIVVLIYFSLTVIFEKKASVKMRMLNLIKPAVVCVVSMLVSKTWKVYVYDLGIKGQFDTEELVLSDYIDVITGKTGGLPHETIKNFIKALFQKPVTSVSWLPLSYFAGFIMIIVFLIVIRLFLKRYYSKREVWITGIALTCGTIGYGLIMGISYAFFFNEVEMRELASFDRYMSSYVLGELLFLFLVFINCLTHRSDLFVNIKKMLIVLGGSILLFDPRNLRFIMPQGFREDSRASYRSDGEHLSGKTEPGSKIFVVYDNEQVSPHWWGAYQAYLQYFDPARFISRERVGSFGYDLEDGKIREDFLEVIKKYDYIYLRNVNYDIKKVFEKDDPDLTIEENSVYKIKVDADKVVLEKV